MNHTAPPVEEDPIQCQRCGLCCQVHLALLTRPDDLERWRNQQRDDILRTVETETQVTNGMGDSALTGPCPYLERQGAVWHCSIYDTRPLVCAKFQPGDSLCSQARRGIDTP